LTGNEKLSMRPFFVVWTGQAFSLVGTQLVQFGLVWWLTAATSSPKVLAMASLAAILPQIVLGPFAGALVDRWNRKAVMVAADTTIALATLALASLFWLGRVETWHIYALMLVRACGAAFHLPAMQASTTLMVPQGSLARVGGMNQGLAGLIGIVTPLLGVLAVEKLPIQGVLALDVATAIPAVLTLLVVNIPQPARAGEAEIDNGRVWILDDLRQGARYVWGWKALIALAGVGVTIHMFGRAAGSLSPLLVLDHFKAGVAGLGWWQSSDGIGLVVGGIFLGVWGGFRRKVVTQLVFLALDGLSILLVGLLPAGWFWLAIGLIFISGFSEAILLGVGGAIFQTLVPPEMQGRVFSLLISLSMAAMPLGLLLAGPTAEVLGVTFWWALTGVVFMATAATAMSIPAVVRIEDSKR
jgi:MFS transporter, DHA3 family, macrolide efflux protein